MGWFSRRRPWFEEAASAMRVERRPGIVVRIPSDRFERHELGHAIEALVNSETREVRRIFETLSVICLDGDAIGERVAGARSEDTLIAVHPDVDPIDGTPLPLGELQREPAFVDQVHRLTRHFRRELLSAKGRLLPYGVEFGRMRSCGDACHEQPEEVTVACGMAWPAAGDRAFIRFLSDPPQ